MHDLDLTHTELYDLFDKKTSKFLGLCHLDFKVEGEDNPDRYLKLTVNLKFTHYDDHRVQTNFSSFLACYIDTHYTEPRASISSHNPFEIGGIEINPSNIAGQRVGGLIFNKIIKWLKSFPNDTQVNPIKFKPTGNPTISKTFYKNFGVPTNGDSFQIADLKFHDTWTQNIKKTNLSAIQQKLSELSLEALELKEKCSNLHKQLCLLSDIQYTSNLFVAFRSCHIQPNLSVQKYDYRSISVHSDRSEESIIGDYLKTHAEVSKSQETLNRYIQVFDEFNEYKQAKNRWRNTGNAIKLILQIHQEKCFVLFFITIILMIFLFWR